MKNAIYFNSLLLTIFLVFTSCSEDGNKKETIPSNYIVVLDLSDRILATEQLEKDLFLIETTFNSFEKAARKGLVLTSKNRFAVKIIPQKNSKLNLNTYEDALHIYLDEINVKDKNTSLLQFSKNLRNVLSKLKKEAFFGTSSHDYFGVDIWAYMHDNGKSLSKPHYKNTVLVLTDGYFDFESQSHVIKEKNQYTSTRFLNELHGSDWKETSEKDKYGLLPISLDKNTKWIIAGISGKKSSDILQIEKITYFWKKWLKESGVNASDFILNSSKTDMGSKLLEQL